MKKITKIFPHPPINFPGMLQTDNYSNSDSSSTLYYNHHWTDKKQFYIKESLDEFDLSKYQSKGANLKRYQPDKLLSNMSIDADAYINKLKHQKENDKGKMFEERKVNIPSSPPKEQIKSLYEVLKEIKEKLDVTVEKQQMLEQELIVTKEEINKLKIENQDLRSENEMRKNLKINEGFKKEKPKCKKNKSKRPSRIRNEHMHYNFETSSDSCGDECIHYETSSDSGQSFHSGQNSDDKISGRRSIKSLREYKKDEFIKRKDFNKLIRQAMSLPNKNSNEIMIDIESDLGRSKTISEIYCAKRISTLKKIGTFVLKKGTNFTSWMEQFPIKKYKDCTQIEYNVILSSFLDQEIIDYLQKNNINPRKMDNNSYFSEIQRICYNNIFSIEDIKLELENKNPKNNEPLDYLIEIFNLVDMIPTTQVPESQKIYMIWQCYKKIFSGSIQLLMENYCRTLAPGLQAYKEGLRYYVRSHHKYLSQDMADCLNLINDNMNEVSEVFSEEENSECYNENESEAALNTNKERKLKLPPKNKVLCNQCLQPNHRDSRCIYNKDPEIAYRNQKRMNYGYCLLCHDLNHMAIDCPIYPDCTAVKNDCHICESHGKIKRKHPASRCISKSND